jgi:hypothetical protein
MIGETLNRESFEQNLFDAYSGDSDHPYWFYPITSQPNA